jgi:hypothetical protein
MFGRSSEGYEQPSTNKIRHGRRKKGKFYVVFTALFSKSEFAHPFLSLFVILSFQFGSELLGVFIP